MRRTQELAEDAGTGAAWMLRAHVYGLTGLGGVLIAAKAVGLTRWPWWLVTAPLWFPWSLVVGTLLGIMVWAFVSALVSRPRGKCQPEISQVRDKSDV